MSAADDVQVKGLDVENAVVLMRSAAAVLRRSLHPSSGAYIHGGLVTAEVASAVADWLESEAAMQESIEPIVELWSAALEHVSGGVSTISLGRDSDGNVAMRAMSTDFGVRLAERILAAG